MNVIYVLLLTILSVICFFLLLKVYKLRKDNILILNERDRLTSQHGEDFNRLLANIFDSLPLPVMVKDSGNDLKYIYWNTEAEIKMGWKREDALGKTDIYILGEKEGTRIREIDKQVLQNRKRIISDEIVEKDGKKIGDVQLIKVVLEHRTVEPWVLMVWWDVTALKEAQRKAEEADHLKATFITNMTHEIRTPLNAIAGFSRLILNGNPEEQKVYSEVVEHNIDILLKLMNDIWDIAQIEANMISFDYSRFNINDMLGDLESLFCLPSDKDMSVIISCDKNAEGCAVYSDKTKLFRVMNGLIKNAIKFTSEGTIKFGSELINGGDMVRLYVSDTGRGIPEDKREEIFERFVKLDDFTQGAGLGLFVCKKLIHSLGGEIGLDSEEGKGSTFWVKLPVSKD